MSKRLVAQAKVLRACGILFEAGFEGLWLVGLPGQAG